MKNKYRKTLAQFIEYGAKPDDAETLFAFAMSAVLQRDGAVDDPEVLKAELPSLRERFPRLFHSPQEQATITTSAENRLPDFLFIDTAAVAKRRAKDARAKEHKPKRRKRGFGDTQDFW